MAAGGEGGANMKGGVESDGSQEEEEEQEELKQIKQRLDTLLKQKHERTIRAPVIYKADPSLRDLKEEHFAGTVVSLGLFGRSSWNGFKVGLRETDVLKIDVLIAFMADIGESLESWARISKQVVPYPRDTKRLYDDQRPPSELSERIIQSALALDSIFVVSFLSFFLETFSSYATNPVETWRVMTLKDLLKRYFKNTFACLSRVSERELLNDIFKMENQIPLQCIKNVAEIIVQSQTGRPLAKVTTDERLRTDEPELDSISDSREELSAEETESSSRGEPEPTSIEEFAQAQRAIETIGSLFASPSSSHFWDSGKATPEPDPKSIERASARDCMALEVKDLEPEAFCKKQDVEDSQKVYLEDFEQICSVAQAAHLIRFPGIWKPNLKFDDQHHLLHSIGEVFQYAHASKEFQSMT